MSPFLKIYDDNYGEVMGDLPDDIARIIFMMISMREDLIHLAGKERTLKIMEKVTKGLDDVSPIKDVSNQ